MHMGKKKNIGRKILSILLTLALLIGLMPKMSLTVYAAQTKTVIWTSQTIDCVGSMSSGGLTLTCTDAMPSSHIGGNFYSGRGGFTFSLDKGITIKKIKITSDNIRNAPAGWSESGNTVTWSGNSTKVSFECQIYDISKIEFTIEVVPVTGITLNNTDVQTVDYGKSIQLSATVSPDDASDKTVKWSSSDTSVATVDSNGKVTGRYMGTATITATTIDGNKTATCTVTVENNHVHIFEAYSANGDTITATCTSEEREVSCLLKNKGYKATLTIVAPEIAGGAASLSGDAEDFGVESSGIKYSEDDGANWTSDAPSGDGFYKACILVADTYNLEVIYGVNAIKMIDDYNAEAKHGDITLPVVATVDAPVTINTTPDAGYMLESLTVTKLSDGESLEVTQDGNSGSFTMPGEEVIVDATFVKREVPVKLKVTGNDGTACKASLMELDNNNYVTVSDTFAKKAGGEFILSVSTDEDYDYRVAFNSESDVGKYIEEFSAEEYRNYFKYVKDNNLSVPMQTEMFRVTMPSVSTDSLDITFTFAKTKTFTVLYQPNEDTDSVWCRFATGTTGSEAPFVVEMNKDAVMGDKAVWSVKVASAFEPSEVDFASSPEDFDTDAMTPVTAGETAPVQDSDWTTVTGGRAVVIGGNAKTVVAAFVSDPNAVPDYDKDKAVFNTGDSNGVIYSLAVCGADDNGNVTSAGTVKAPSAPTGEAVPSGKKFDGWAGLVGEAPNKEEKLYAENETVSIKENTTFNVVWKQASLSVALDKDGGTGGTNITSVPYGEKLNIPNNPTKNGYTFNGWTVKKAVTENGVSFAEGSVFDIDTPITEDIELTAQWKHVHAYKCVQLNYPGFNDALKKYYNHLPYIHVKMCGCSDVELVAHNFSNGVCTDCGYTKPEATEVELNVSYWKDGASSAWIHELPRTVKKNEEVTVSAFYKSGDYQFSRWEYSTDNGKTWRKLVSATMVGFIIPCDMEVRAVYVSTIKKPQISLSASKYTNAGTAASGGKASILYHMDYKLPENCTFVDAGVRLGDNDGISYYELKERKRTAGERASWGTFNLGIGVIGCLISGDGYGEAIIDSVEAAATMKSTYYYESRENSVLKEITAEKLSDYMYQFKPVNAEKYPPVYWESKAETKGQSGSMYVLTPVSFAQKNNGNHYIYGMTYLRYKDANGEIKTIYTKALQSTLNKIPTDTVTKKGS